ncbi:MAG: hypothetical protein ACFCUO_00795 [Rhodospirillales bacterium]
MKPARTHGDSPPYDGLTVRLADGTVVSIDGLMAEARRLRARETRRWVAAGVGWIVAAVRSLAVLAPAAETRRKIPRLMPMIGGAAAMADPMGFRTDAALGHAAAGTAEGIARDEAGGGHGDVRRPLAA